MPRWTDALVPKLLILALGVLLMASAQGQSLNSGQDTVRLQVKTLQLTGWSQTSRRAPDPDEAHRQLLSERARFGETMTVDELHQLADALTLYLRTRGHAFHTVYLPSQKVEGGVVELRVREGMLADIHVINNTRWSDKQMKKPFQRLKGKLLYGPQVDEAVQALKAQSGFRVFAFYSRGPNSGEAILNLRVDPTKKRAFGFKADNHGSPASGEHRVIMQYSEYQLTGHHDRLSLSVLQAVDGVPNTYGSLAYHLPFGALNYAWDVSASNNQFEVGDRFAALGLKGGASTLRTGLSAITGHHPNNRSAWRLGVYDKRNNFEAGQTQVTNEQSQAASLQWSKTLQSAEAGAVMQSLLEYSHGQYTVNGLPDGAFNKVDFSLLLAKGLGSGRWRNSVQLNTRGQYSDVMLPSIESLGLTGAYGVRGFAPGLFNADSAVLAALEWRLPSVFNKDAFRMEPFLFGEYSAGYKTDALGASRDARFAGAGMGLNLGWRNNLAIQVVVARAATGDIDGLKVQGDDQILFEIRLQ